MVIPVVNPVIIGKVLPQVNPGALRVALPLNATERDKAEINEVKKLL